METLPVEIVEKITTQLTPEDISRCCGVSREWREVFDQDWIWEPLCDAELEEPLRTTPCVVEPVFATPKVEGSSLSPISNWRLAFIREKHLWNNWEHSRFKVETCLELLENEGHRDFLTNNLIVKWFTNHIEVWDVSVSPIVFVAKSDPSVDIHGWIHGSVVREDLLVVEQMASVKVFFVDIINKYIQLKHDISLDDLKHEPLDPGYYDAIRYLSSGGNRPHELHQKNYLNCIKGSVFFHVSVSRSNLVIVDLETGKIKKKEKCPVVGNENERAKIFGVKSSPCSEDVVVLISVPGSPDNKNCHYYIYSPTKLCFLPGPIAMEERDAINFPIFGTDYGEINSHFLGVCDGDSLFKIYDYHSLEIVFKSKKRTSIRDRCVFNDSFIFFEYKYDEPRPNGHLRIISLSSSIVTTIHEYGNVMKILTINNKFIAVFDLSSDWDLWEISRDQVLEKSSISLTIDTGINQGFTKEMLWNCNYGSWLISHHW